MIINCSKQSIKIVYVGVLFLYMFSACNKKLDVPTPALSSDETEWLTLNDARSNLLGIYALFRSACVVSNNYWLWGELRGGDFTAVSRPDLQAVINGNLNASYTTLDDMKDWRRFYAAINAANLFLENSGKVMQTDGRYTKLNHDVDMAQVRALRAWIYFVMVRIWGDIPLITSSHDGEFPALPRTSQSSVLAFCESELLSAAPGIPFTYGDINDPVFPSSIYEGPGYTYGVFRNTLVTQIAAYTLLAHIAAWQGRYSDADIYAQFVLDNYTKSVGIDYSSTSWLTQPDGFFFSDHYAGSSSPMLNFNMSYSTNDFGTSGVGHIESWTLAAPLISRQTPDIYVPADTINKIFTDVNDERFGFDSVTQLPRVNYFTNYNSEIPVFSKIKSIGAGTTNGSFAVYSSLISFSRMEEITLLKAEADAVLNKLQGNTGAIALLNIIRSERGEKAYSPVNPQQNDVVDSVFAERRRELIGEGWRWYDLVRYNKIRRNDSAFNTLIDRGGIYWPISSAVIAANPSIVQNSYWNENSN